MACGGFTCSKNALAFLNFIYIVVAFILIGVAAYGRAAAVVTSIDIVGSIIACGVFLLILAIIGMIGAVKHHQVLLFFYMIILFLLFLLQFSLSCACLAFNNEQKDAIAKTGWKHSSKSTRQDVQKNFDCCGFLDNSKATGGTDGHPTCYELPCCKDHPTSPCCRKNETMVLTDVGCPCQTCFSYLQSKIYKAFTAVGAVGLFFSFTEIVGVGLAMRYRNQKDPRANPSAFL